MSIGRCVLFCFVVFFDRVGRTNGKSYERSLVEDITSLLLHFAFASGFSLCSLEENSGGDANNN